MSSQLVIVEQRSDWKPQYPDIEVATAGEYISDPKYAKLKNLRIFNLCRNYRYLSLGYYCSLLAEARQHKILPTVKTITDLSSKSIYSLNIEDLHNIIQKSLKSKSSLDQNAFTLFIYFGQCADPDFSELARQLFDIYPSPALRVEFKLQADWQISAIRSGHFTNWPEEQVTQFIQAFNAYSTKRWLRPKETKHQRYDLAILVNPEDPLPPSNKRALKKFEKIGKELGLAVDFITKKDFSRLAEYDALFIRETTQIDHHTFRFARRAESEGLVVIDDPTSIVKCTNKIFLFEQLTAQKIPIPITRLLKKDDPKDITALEKAIPYPIVLKMPQSSFSRGVHKVKDHDELIQMTTQLFSESDILLAQEYMYTEYDWRIGVLNGEPLYACQYFMSRHHWQIVKHTKSGKFSTGQYKTWPIDQVDPKIIKTALQSTQHIGNGLYGVDLKFINNKVKVIEVNDNPNIDAGVEDAFLKNELYYKILGEFTRRLDNKKSGNGNGWKQEN